MHELEALLAIARDLTASLSASDRHSRLLETIRRAIPCDAAALLVLEGSDVVPLATYGLVPEVLGRRLPRAENPRLERILESSGPVLFAADDPSPDPFDGLLAADRTALGHVHACLGCPLKSDGRVVGALTADALAPNAFEYLDHEFLASLGALAGAALRTSRLVEALERAAEHQRLVAADLLRDATQRSGGLLLGTSPAMQKLRAEISLVAPSDLCVLIQGETGVGKELVAHALHAASTRRELPLIHVNCAALPESIAESELFGHVRGAFTGAGADRPGKFEVADGGTLFLDEVGELPLAVQPKLLRALQSGEIQRVGSDRTRAVDVRIVAATNRELALEVKAGRFRADLFHRLNGYPLEVRPLRERREDIALLAGHFLDVYRRRLGLGPVRLSPAARHALEDAPWPGNVRELENLLGRAVLWAKSSSGPFHPVVIGPEHLALENASPTGGPSGPVEGSAPAIRPMRESVELHKRSLVRAAVEAAGGNWSDAARRLGLHRSNLHHLARRLGLLHSRDAGGRRPKAAASPAASRAVPSARARSRARRKAPGAHPGEGGRQKRP